MKGLLRKDLIMIWKYCKSILLIVLFFLVCSYLVRDNWFFVTYPAMQVGMLPVSLISYDERSKWNVYCQTFPLPRWKVVVSKYLVSLISLITVTALTAVTQFIIFRQSEPFDIDAYLTVIQTTFVLSCLSASLMLPLVYKLGSEKARSVYALALGGIWAVTFTLAAISPSALFSILTSLRLSVLAAGLFAGSCLLSIHFYNKRDL